MDTAKDTPAEQHRMEKEDIEDLGTVTLSRGGHVIHCLTVIGQIEGHTEAPQGQKTTKYEHRTDRQHLQAQRHAGAGRRALHRHPAGGQRAAQLHRPHRHHDGAPGAALRADLRRPADHALL